MSVVKRFLGFPQQKDADLSFLRMQHDSVAAMCGLEGGVFDQAYRVLRLALSLDMRNPVLYSAEEQSRYRFCSECLISLRTPYFPLHWRFNAYRMCKRHQCLMEENCPHCGAMVCPEESLAIFGKIRRSRTFSSQCFRCSKFLWDMIPLKVDDIPDRLFNKNERMQLANGSAFFAALVAGKVSVQDSNETDIRVVFPRMERAGRLYSRSKSRTTYLRKQMPAKYWRSVQHLYYCEQ